MAKTVYFLKNNDELHAKIVDDDYELDKEETLTVPQDGLCAPFSFVNGIITGTPLEEFEKNEVKNKSSEELISDFTQQFATVQLSQSKINAQLIKQNAMLTKQVNDLQSEKETANG